MNDLGKFLKALFSDIKNFFFIYVIYFLLALTFSSILLCFVFRFIPLTNGTIYNSCVSYLSNLDNVKYVVTHTIFFIIIMSSLAYVTVIKLKKSDEIKSNEIKNEIVSVNSRIEKIDTAICSLTSDSRLKLLDIIDYKVLMIKEAEHDCSEILIVTNDLKDDMEEAHFFDIIIQNLIKKKKYKFIVPDMKSNNMDGCKLLLRIFDKLKEKKICDEVNSISYFFEVYLVVDSLFRICAFRDIAIYGAGVKDKNIIGYAELPYINKNEDPNNRYFIPIDKDVCKQTVQDIDRFIKTSQYVQPLSCDLDSYETKA